MRAQPRSGGEEKVVRSLDQDAGEPEVRQRAQVALVGAVDDIDAVRARVSDVDETPGRVHAGVIEARLVARR